MNTISEYRYESGIPKKREVSYLRYVYSYCNLQGRQVIVFLLELCQVFNDSKSRRYMPFNSAPEIRYTDLIAITEMIDSINIGIHCYLK